MGGLFGVISKKNCMEDLWFGTDYLSHLGADSAGLALLGDELFEPVSRDIRKAPFRTAFQNDFDGLKKLEGFAGIGIMSDIKNDNQPIRIASKKGNFTIATTGLVKNANELFYQLQEKNVKFNQWFNQTEVIGQLIKEGDSILDGIKKMYEVIEGDVSLVILSEEDKSLYVSSGIFPTALGKSKNNNGWAVASDTTPFLNLDYDIVDSLKYREVAVINEEDTVKKIQTTNKNVLCPFLYVYFAFPAYDMYGVNSEIVRGRCGGFLAQKDMVEADTVFGVESSGLPHATGYAEKKLQLLKEGVAEGLKELEEEKITLEEYKNKVEALEKRTPPLRRAVIKYIPSWGRSYIPSDQAERDLIADKKQVSNPQLIKGNIMIVVDDSIRRGTQFKNYVKNKIDPYGPKEVHGRIGSPVQMFPCFYDQKTILKDLASHKAIRNLEGKKLEDFGKYMVEGSPEYEAMVKQIAKDIGLDSLMLVNLDEMTQAIVGAPGNQGIRPENLCTYCWTGKAP